MQLEEVIARSPVTVHGSDWWVTKCLNHPELGNYDQVLSMVQDDTEITCVNRSGSLNPDNVISSVGPFALLRFAVASPFGAPGFIGRICSSLGAAGVAVFVISTFSYDYVLVHAEDLNRTIELLSSEGFDIEGRPSE